MTRHPRMPRRGRPGAGHAPEQRQCAGPACYSGCLNSIAAMVLIDFGDQVLKLREQRRMSDTEGHEFFPGNLGIHSSNPDPRKNCLWGGMAVGIAVDEI